MVHKVLIDEEALGWGKKNIELIKKKYEIVFMVGTNPAPLQGSGDELIGNFCEKENCNILTGDYTLYLDLLNNPRISAIQIEKFAVEDTKRQIHLIRIL